MVHLAKMKILKAIITISVVFAILVLFQPLNVESKRRVSDYILSYFMKDISKEKIIKHREKSQ